MSGRVWSGEQERWVYPDEAKLPNRMRNAADTIDELLSITGPWNSDPNINRWAAEGLRKYADSFEELLGRVLGEGDTSL